MIKAALNLMAFTISITTLEKVNAWGEIGHGAVGYIAESKLTPEARHLVHKILGVEPLAVSSFWPDQVRSDDRFKELSAYHYVDFPEGSDFNKMPNHFRASKSAHVFIDQVPDILISSKYSRNQKLILLRYLAHVVGDIHMPLHVGNGIDMGANLCQVKWKDPFTSLERLTNLHTVWDEDIIQVEAAEFQKTAFPGQKRFFGYKEFAGIILAGEGNPTYEEANSTTKEQWYAESRNLHNVVYPDLVPVKSPMERVYCKMVDPKTRKVVDGNFDATKVSLLSDAYVKKALPLVKRQVILGGYRLAGILNAAAIKGRVTPLKDVTQKKLIESILLKDPKAIEP